MNIWCHLATSRCLSEQPTCTSEGRRGSNTKHANGTSCPRRLCVSIIVYGEWAGLHSSYIHLFVTSFSPGKPHSASIWSHSRLWRYVWKKNGGVRGDFEGSTFAGTGSKGNERLFEKHSCQMTACHVYVRQIFSYHHTHWTRERMHYQWGWHGNTGGGRGGGGGLMRGTAAWTWQHQPLFLKSASLILCARRRVFEHEEWLLHLYDLRNVLYVNFLVLGLVSNSKQQFFKDHRSTTINQKSKRVWRSSESQQLPTNQRATKLELEWDEMRPQEICHFDSARIFYRVIFWVWA